MARVSVEQKALTDSRFVELGRIIGADRHAGLGRMVHVWNECQERGSITLQRSTIDNTNPDVPDFCAAIVQAELACEVEGGAFYIRGTPGRIEWLEKSRRNGKKGAAHGVKGGRPTKTPDGVSEEPRVGLSNKPPLALAPAPAPKEERTSLSRAAARTKKELSEGSEPYRLAVLLRDEIRKNDPGFPGPKNLQAWATEIERTIRLDKREPREIAKVIVWCQEDSFWRSNVLSAAKLREHFTKLKMKRAEGAGASRASGDAIREEGIRGVQL